ncbi:hypothetical protein SDRG_16801 [Saprolegnia diclina VS20]|uniref:Uncharacterized protein n=1 Tax=Saprolegnia diclina (strain VS20) TaxID=1156394 RepID=T0R030_SAPDV|nr:hypothetical protein SDRG_16801 [Saprolegnia diclina VS20]EQC25338.1 hypothetical protein SDRG_16801 [Saprolegnia diclina VS20]|eukprot:XP_008621243.1 hypothetical protein SDRG_16801 [Saprolegnia diclina VS20]
MACVLRCADLVRAIVAYQSGAYGDVRPLLRLLYSVRLPRPAALSLLTYARDLRAAYASFHDAFVRIDGDWRRLAATPKASDAMMYYAIVFGNVAILRHRDASGAPFLTPLDDTAHEDAQLEYLRIALDPSRDRRGRSQRTNDPSLVRARLSMRSIELACVGGHLDVIEYLHQNDAGCVQMHLWGKMVAEATAAAGHVSVLRYFHDHGYEGATRTAINAAARYGHLPVIEYLVETCGLWSDNAIEWAAHYRHTDLIRSLAARSNHRHVQAALHAAVDRGDIRIVRALREVRPDVGVLWSMLHALVHHHINLFCNDM